MKNDKLPKVSKKPSDFMQPDESRQANEARTTGDLLKRADAHIDGIEGVDRGFAAITVVTSPWFFTCRRRALVLTCSDYHSICFFSDCSGGTPTVSVGNGDKCSARYR